MFGKGMGNMAGMMKKSSKDARRHEENARRVKTRTVEARRWRCCNRCDER